MRKLCAAKILVSIVCLCLVCVACGSEVVRTDINDVNDVNVETETTPSEENTDAGMTDDANNTETESILSGTLRISDFMDFSGGTSELAAGFMLLHPQVSITVENVDKEFFFSGDYLSSFSTVQSSFSQRLQVQLLSGEDAPDIVKLETLLNLEKAAANGLLIDLYPYWNNDPSINREDYFDNILKLREYNGSLYSILTTFSFPTVHINKRVTDALEIDIDAMSEITANELLVMYLTAFDKGIINNDNRFEYVDGGKNSLMPWFMIDYLSIETGTARFDSPDFIDYLEKTNLISTERTVFTGDSTFFPEAFEEDNNALYMSGALTLGQMRWNEFSSVYTSSGIPLLTPNGKLVVSGASYAITSSSKNPDLAWEFIKYCIIEGDEAPYMDIADKDVDYILRETPREINGDRFAGAFPINKNNFRKYMISCFANNDLVFTEELYNKYLLLAENASAVFLDTGDEFGVNDILTLYYDNGLIDARECARQLQERAEIYLAE